MRSEEPRVCSRIRPIRMSKIAKPNSNLLRPRFEFAPIAAACMYALWHCMAEFTHCKLDHAIHMNLHVPCMAQLDRYRIVQIGSQESDGLALTVQVTTFSRRRVSSPAFCVSSPTDQSLRYHPRSMQLTRSWPFVAHVVRPMIPAVD
jgi:hypothetical protein